MQDYQNIFNRALADINIQLIERIIKNVRIRNNNSRKHTLNYAISKLFVSDLNKFNLNIIKILLDNGAKPCYYDTGDNDTLSLTIEKGIKYIKKYETEENLAENNILNLIKLLINYGIKSNDEGYYSLHKCYQNTFSLIVKSGNLRIINLVLTINPIPDNIDYKTSTLSFAIKTSNVEIVKLALIHGATTHKYSLNYAIETTNPDIVKEIIINGNSEPMIECDHRYYDKRYIN